MDLTDDATRARWRQHLGDLFRDRKVICGIAPLAGFSDWVTLLAEVGAQRPLVVASGVGAGPVPGADEAEVVFLDVPQSESMTEELRAQDGIARRLPDEVVAAVERYDPDGRALWMVGPFMGTAPLLGREVVGGRPAAWTALEDKLLVDALWDTVGAPRAGSRSVPVDRESVRATADGLDEGAGVVLTGDARDGFNGGGDFVRWVVTDDDLDRALRFFRPRCDRVRVMPFLDGVPCSVHGMVLPTGTAAFRPVELAILRGEQRRFVYGGQGTTWDPPASDRTWMRELVSRTGEQLRKLVGYRGAFGIDGVLTRDGFRPTELNSRLSGGLAAMTKQVDTGLFTLLQLNLLHGRDVGVAPDELEAWAVPAMDAVRVCRAIAVVPVRVAAEPFDVHVHWDGADLQRSWDPTGWRVEVGPNPAGTFCRVAVPADQIDGVRVGALNAALMRFLDAELGTRIGPVTAPPDVRAP
ncbi:MAG: hypothetical protein HOQ22_00770 [Nocardioidaceae bacterium]|nr:hypothetical protein [Nocardioidaceae bacterium]NUS49561.1 hypothetical protein [Nocardioidaceae bacterium]